MLFEGQHEGCGASACASAPSGRWTAIWSASKSALEGAAHERVQLDGLALDELGLEGLDAQAVQGGARLSSTGCSRMTSARTSQTLGLARSTMRLAALTFWASLSSTSRFMTKGLEQLQGHLAWADRTGGA